MIPNETALLKAYRAGRSLIAEGCNIAEARRVSGIKYTTERERECYLAGYIGEKRRVALAALAKA